MCVDMQLKHRNHEIMDCVCQMHYKFIFHYGLSYIIKYRSNKNSSQYFEELKHSTFFQ
jgi:hypothetical protein